MKKGAPQFEARWPNAKAIRVGWLAGRGNQSTDIATILADGTTPESIRTQLQRANLDALGKKPFVVFVPVALSRFERTELGKRAAARELPIEDWIRKVAVNAAIPQDIFDAIVPGTEE